MVAPVDFSDYLQSLVDAYNSQPDLYTLTDLQVEIRAESSLSPEQPQAKKKIERSPVLAGLRKYVQKGHVLLVGKPGSGKSTALQRLLWELAQAALDDEMKPIPVLVTLRSDRSIPEAICAELRQVRLRVALEQIDEWLLGGRLFLLLDGLNEIPSQAREHQINQFRKDNLHTLMVFTSRELGTALGIEQKLEMCGLTEPQTRSFVEKYLPNHAEQLLRQLKDRLRELAETPLLLKLLCEVFDPETQQIPQSKGELFRAVDRKYNTWKTGEGARTSEKFWQWNGELLRSLAFSMLRANGSPTGKWLQVDRLKAEQMLERFLQGRVTAPGEKAKDWLQDLLNHHLLQRAANPNQIEFRHQLFQEYYAAEYLLLQLESLSDDQLKHDYLNLLKWTEPLAMMVALANQERAGQVVKLALQVDWTLGARLAGEVLPQFQEQTVREVNQLIARRNLPEWLKVELLGETRSPKALTALLKFLSSNDLRIAQKAAAWIGFIGDAVVLPDLIQRLGSLEKWVFEKDLHTSLSHLGKAEFGGKVLSHEAAALEAEIIKVVANLSPQHGKTKLCEYIKEPSSFIDSFMQPSIIDTLAACEPILAEEQALSTLENCNTINSVNKIHQLVGLLAELKSAKAPSVLIKKLSVDESTQFHEAVIYSLGLFDSEDAVEALVELISSPIPRFREKSKEALIKNRRTKAVYYLTRHLHKPDWDIRWWASVILGEFGNDASLAVLSEGLAHENHRIRATAAKLLGNLDPKLTLSLLISALHDSTYSVRRNAAISLAGFNRCEAIPELLKALCHYYPTDASSSGTEIIFHITDDFPILITGFTQEALSLLGDHEAISDWLLERKFCSKSREYIADALGNFNTKEVQNALIESLHQGNKVAAIPLAKFGRKEVVRDLVELLKNSNLVSSTNKITEPLVALIEAGNCEIVPEIIMLLKDVERHIDDHGNRDYYFRNRLAIVLMEIQHAEMPQYIPDLLELLATEVGQQAYWAIASIQANCQFYNYDIFQPPLELAQLSSDDLLDKINQTTQQIDQRTKRMADQPNITISGGTFPGNVYLAPHQGDNIGTQNNHFGTDEALKRETADLRQFIVDLETRYPDIQTEAEADNILDAEIVAVQTANPTHWQTLRHQMTLLKRQLLNPERHLQATKATIIEVAKSAYEKSLIVKAILTYIDKLSEEPNHGA